MRPTLSSLMRPMALAGVCLAGVTAACQEAPPPVPPSITFHTIPPSQEGDRIAWPSSPGT